MKNLNSTAGLPAVGSLKELHVEKLTIGGAGLARLDGLVYFIPKTAPGDLIKAQVVEVKKNHAFAKLIEIIQPSQMRRQPPCTIANRCGGCSWQHLTEADQCQQKELLFLETLNKFLPNLKIPEFKIKANSKPFGYRNRIQPKVTRHDFGFFAESSHQIITTDQCLIAEDRINQEWAKIKSTIQGKIKENELKKIEIYLDENEIVRYHEMAEADDGIGFSQVNRFQNEDLIQSVLKMVAELKPENIFEFYSGAGNFTFPIYDLVKPKSMVAVEMNPKLVQRAKEKIGKRKINYFCASVDNYVKRLNAQNSDLIILDPPRVGCGLEVMKALAAIKPQNLIYISCHPVSLVRDLKPFVDLGYQVKKIELFDMFSQTDHMESIVHIYID